MNADNFEPGHEFREQAVFRIEEALRMIRISLKELDEDAFWYRPNEVSNGVGQLLEHLSGNIKQYILSGLGGEKDTRERDREFESTGRRDREAVEQKFFETVRLATSVIENLPESSWLQKKQIQGFDLTGLGIVLHVVEHLSYHTGQIAYLTKLINNSELGFYRGRDLNVKNQ